MDTKLGMPGFDPTILGPNTPKPPSHPGAPSMGEAFEAILLQQLFVSMRQTVPKSGLFAGSSTDGLYDHLIEQAMGEHLARSGGIGVAPLFDEPPVPNGNEHPGRLFAWREQTERAGDGRLGVHSATIETAAQRPLADTLPPQDDPWLDQPDAAGKLRTLLGGDER